MSLDVCHSVTNHQRRNYAKADFSGIRTELQQIEWDTLLSGDIHSSWMHFKNKLHELESKFILLATTKSKQGSKPIWMTNKALKLVRRKGSIYKRYKDNDHPACKKANEEARRALKESKRKFEKMLANNIRKDKKASLHMLEVKANQKLQSDHC